MNNLSGKTMQQLAQEAGKLQEKAAYIVKTNGEDFTHTQLVRTVADLHDLVTIYVTSVLALQKLLSAQDTNKEAEMPQHEHLKDEHASEHVEGDTTQNG